MRTSFIPYQQGMQALVQRVRAIDVSTFERGSRELLSKDLAPRTTTLVEQANRLVRSVLEASEPDGEVEDLVSDTPGEDASPRMDAPPSSAIADIAFMANFELHQRATRLAGIAPDADVVWIAECDRALRKIKKSLGALDRAISRVAETPAHLDFGSERTLSLRVRKAYGTFRRRSMAGQTECNTPDQLEAALRRTGHQIAVLAGSAIHPELRLDDRTLLRTLQRRILAWLRSPERDTMEARILWQDSSALFAMLRHVSRRQELVEHDARVLHAVLDSVAAGESLSESHKAALTALEGLDDELDDLLADWAQPSTVWITTLRRIVKEAGYSRPSIRP